MKFNASTRLSTDFSCERLWQFSLSLYDFAACFNVTNLHHFIRYSLLAGKNSEDIGKMFYHGRFEANPRCLWIIVKPVFQLFTVSGLWWTEAWEEIQNWGTAIYRTYRRESLVICKCKVESYDRIKRKGTLQSGTHSPYCNSIADSFTTHCTVWNQVNKSVTYVQIWDLICLAAKCLEQNSRCIHLLWDRR